MIIKKKKEIIKKLKNLIKKKINPKLNKHNGKIKFIDIDKNNFLIIKLEGKCKKCNMSFYTINNYIKKKIKKKFKFIKEIININ